MFMVLCPTRVRAVLCILGSTSIDVARTPQSPSAQAMTADPPKGSATCSFGLNHWRAMIVAGLGSRAHGWDVSGPDRTPDDVKLP